MAQRRSILVQPVRAFADSAAPPPPKKGFLSRLLFGDRDEAKPERVEVPEQPAVKRDPEPAATAATAAPDARKRTREELVRDELLNADLEKLGRETLEAKEGAGVASDVDSLLVAMRSRGAFTMNEYLILLRSTPKKLQLSDGDDAKRVLEAMSEGQRKNNVLMNPAMLSALGPELAKKAGVAADVPGKLVTQFQIVEAILSAVRKWQDKGEPIPKTMKEIQEKAMRDGSFNHIMGKLRALAKAQQAQAQAQAQRK
jgi:hypothetical protein